MSIDVYRVSYRSMPFLMSEEAEIIVNELNPIESVQCYYIDKEAIDELEKTEMNKEVIRQLRKLVKQSKHGGFDVSIS